MYENITIGEFKDAMWGSNKAKLSKEDIDTVNSEYVDLAGIYDADEFSRVAYITYLNGRINKIKLAIRLQREFINNFDIPFLNELKFFKQFGYTVHWNKNRVDFENQLKKIESREGRFEDEVEGKIKELIELRLSKNKKEYVSDKQTLESFMLTYISLGKVGYSIDVNSTTMQEFALMIKHQKEENQKFAK